MSLTVLPPQPPALRITFPENLPVSARRDEIMATLAAHQVTIVCGETGSGKTTQLPKMALALGRAQRVQVPGKDGKLRWQGPVIGHTQPRRIAATSVAQRIADELDTPLGEVVGYKVRFNDRLTPGARVKLMTDGILLAETQTDPLLRGYDTLIIDEAHERSLNIDFLLGFLRQLLPKRPDLKLIVTSATIDAERFATYFADAKGQPAPVLMVSGRTFPVEVRYRPFNAGSNDGESAAKNDSKEPSKNKRGERKDLNDAIADAADELWRGGAVAGDILIFLPGEREIREAADHLTKHLSHHPVLRHTEVLPLFARLSQAEQERVFHPKGQRRIVLATNVAETSLTVPGIRYVIDVGTARVKRYSLRQKVEQLLVEPISQAAANQRSGRCGRVADGICIRLYDEADFNGRPKFTDPEILRSSLAGVILRMKTLHLHGDSGGVEDFPFIEPPSRRAFADGYALLQELGGVDERLQLTDVGRQLAHLPLDPRVGRMILAAHERGALAEVLVIASALSLQDVRDRPIDRQAAAQQAHAKWDDEKSEFSGTLRLWNWLEGLRGHKAGQVPDEDAPAQPTHKLSHRQQEQALKDAFIHVRRVREWRDIHTQLHTVVAEHRWTLNTQPAGYEVLHKSMLAGLLGNVGCKSDDQDHYNGARGIKFHRHPGANLSKKPGRWIVAAELVETTRLFGRGLANIEPQWLEEVGGHLLNRQTSDPQWDKRSAQVIAHERATLYGLQVYQGRRVSFGRLDPAEARRIFIRSALVEGAVPDDWPQKLPFWSANQRLIRQVQELEHKARRQDVLVDEELIFAYYNQHIPADVCTGAAFERWYGQAVKQTPKLLQLTKDELMRHEAAGITTQAFPKVIRLGGVDCAASYLHEPGDAKDGLSVTVPLFVLNQVSEDRTEWLVPGMLKDKVLALLKTLHQRPRSRLVPLPDTASRFADALTGAEAFGHGNLMDALLKLVREATQLDIKRADIKADMLSPHHLMHIRVVDEHGRQLGAGRSLAALKGELGTKARGAFQALAALKLSPQDEGKKEPPALSNEAQAAIKKGANAAPAASPASAGSAASKAPAPSVAGVKHTTWAFGELPELMEIKKGGQTLIGFPALIDQGDGVTIEVFDEPELAAAKHRAGLRRLFALHIKDALKYLEKNLPGLQPMGVAFMGLGTSDDLKTLLLDLALDRAFLQDPLPTDANSFNARVAEGRGRLTLIANEVARLCGTILTEHTAAQRKLKDSKPAADVATDVQQQLARLVTKRFLLDTPWAQLQHLPRYLKGVQLRLDKLRADPARDAAKLAELKPQDQRYWRLVAERKGQVDDRMAEFRWLLEELRISFFAQELRTPQPVSVKRLDKAWAQLNQ
ncbi:MAG TPA: ATP-dependent RNA helicase HrpA [Burkholderiaceae bacterium]|nr:ATP-dependent RNA helicase HrpA [Burkholderiaceae bacterium]